MTVRKATHAGSWYTSNSGRLDKELDSYLSAVDPKLVPARFDGVEPNWPSPSPAGGGASESVGGTASRGRMVMPVKGCRAIIAPHAGYSYSGPAAAWAYKCIDVTAIKRVFILGPSHHFYLDGCALSRCEQYDTPLGKLELDQETIAKLRSTGKFTEMTLDVDEDEHSIEMHLPYVRKVFEKRDIKIVPILVGAISSSSELKFGKLLAPYLDDPANLFVISSDFCHWGLRFNYTYYTPSPTGHPAHLTRSSLPSSLSPDFPIHASITTLDHAAMDAISIPAPSPLTPTTNKSARQAHDEFSACIKRTRNTVCGRHPIGVLLGALVALEEADEKKKTGAGAAEGRGRGAPKRATEVRFVRYEQSSQCVEVADSSVSYASAFIKW